MTRSSKIGSAQKIPPVSRKKIVASRGKQMSPAGGMMGIKQWADSIRIPPPIRSQIMKAAACIYPSGEGNGGGRGSQSHPSVERLGKRSLSSFLLPRLNHRRIHPEAFKMVAPSKGSAIYFFYPFSGGRGPSGMGFRRACLWG